MIFKANKKDFSSELKKMSGDSAIVTASIANQRVTLESVATDGQSVQTSFEAEVKEPGCYAQQTKTLLPAVEGTAGDFVTLKTEGDDEDVAVFTLKGEGTRFRLNGVRLSTLIKVNFNDAGENASITTELFNTIVDKVLYAASAPGKSRNRPVLEALNLVMAPGGVVAIATDFYRLAKYEVRGHTGLTAQHGFVMPGSFVSRVKKDILSRAWNKDGSVSISCDGKKVMVSDGITTIQSPLPFGAYPSVSKLIPDKFMTEVTLNCREFADAVERVSFLKTDNVSIIKIDIHPDTGKIGLSSRTQEIGDFEQEIEGEITGEPLKLAISSNYLSEALKRVEGEKVKISFASEMKPLIITDPEDAAHLHLMLPVRTYD